MFVVGGYGGINLVFADYYSILDYNMTRFLINRVLDNSSWKYDCYVNNNFMNHSKWQLAFSIFHYVYFQDIHLIPLILNSFVAYTNAFKCSIDIESKIGRRIILVRIANITDVAHVIHLLLRCLLLLPPHHNTLPPTLPPLHHLLLTILMGSIICHRSRWTDHSAHYHTGCSLGYLCVLHSRSH